MLKPMFTGRIGIRLFWLSTLLLILVTIGAFFLVTVLSIVGAMLFGVSSIEGVVGGFLVIVGLSYLIAILVAIPGFGLTLRRYHDVGLSVWVFLGLTLASWVVSWLFPVLPIDDDPSSFSLTNFLISLPISIIMLAILVWPGKKEDNKYGPQTRYTSLWSAIKGMKPEAVSVATETPAA